MYINSNFSFDVIHAILDNCNLGDYAYQKACLKFNKVAKTWKDARKHCRSDGGDLVEIADTDHRKRFYIRGEHVTC